MNQHPLIKTFCDAVDQGEIIDSSMAEISDDDSAVTYSISKFYNLETSANFNVLDFLAEFKKKYRTYDIEANDDGFVLSKELCGFLLNYELDIFDGSLKLEIYTTGSSDNSPELIKELAGVMLEEFSSFHGLLYKNNN